MERLPFGLVDDDEARDDGPGRYVVVAVERGVDAEGLTYRDTDEPLAEGDRVEVPLGRGNTPTAGLVVRTGGAELLGGFDPGRVKRVLRRSGGSLPGSLIELARWISGYYVTPLGMVLSAMMPAAVKQGVGVRTREVLTRPADAATRAEVAGRLPPATRRVWEAVTALPDEAFPIDPGELAARAGASNRGPINRLIDLGLLDRGETEEVRVFGESGPSLLGEGRAEPPRLTDGQRAVVDGIDAARSRSPFGVHLVRGVTGSGKTEVYIRLLERVLGEGKSAIVLVPEIALTPQTAGRFVSRFASGPGAVGVEVLHSGLSASARHRAWSRLASGRSRVAVGARSVVFAPLVNVGLIVVDEEHDASYKQDQLPRYNSRDVAIKRAQLAGAHVVLGSATPSLESWWNAMAGGPGRAGRFTLWELPERVAGRMPRVRIVRPTDRDPGEDGAKAEGSREAWIGIGPILARAMAETFGEGGQAILLLNRRGFASYVACPSGRCGWSMGCESCDARMVVHRSGLKPGQNAPRGYLRCHHCLAESLAPSRCPECGGTLALVGLGIQRVEAELTRRFGLEPGRDFLRLDSDSVSRASDYFTVLDRFARGELRLLLGTQMIAKGLDFPNVRLVGVVNADTSLSQPDFRAAERTFQLVSQVAGRAGRGAEAGLVIVQTMHPAEPAIALAARHDYVAFATHELALRRANGLPPATRMARVVCRDRDAEKADAEAAAVARLLRERAPAGVRVEGPMPCVISRVADHFRVGVEITAPDAGTLTRLLAALRASNALKSDAHTAIDVDPVSLM